MRRAVTRPIVHVFLLAAALPLLASGMSPMPAANAQATPRFKPNEVLVKFKDGATEPQKRNALARIAARAVEKINSAAMKWNGDPGVIRAAIQAPVQQAIAELQKDPNVELVEPNWIYRHQAVSNDPYYGNGHLWGAYGDATTPSNTFGSKAGQAWAAGNVGSSTVYVGIIDEGVQISHPDLAANIGVNPGESGVDSQGRDKRSNGVDDDVNGYVDDVNGWDFYRGDNSVFDANEDTHGTHVAGTIGAVGGNGMGVAGMNWQVKMLSAKFLGPDGGYASDAVKAVDYFTNLKVKHGLNIVAINNSWGGGGYSQALHDAIIRAAKAGILFTAAAGNGGDDGRSDNNDVIASYPANYNTTVGTSTESAAGYDSVISVAAIDRYGALAGFSNYGATKVDLGAPGVMIYSTLPSNTYGAYSGTSMATPHVTGALALYAAVNPGATALDIKNGILNSVVPTFSLDGKTLTDGRLDVANFAPQQSPPVATHDLAVTSVTAPASVSAGQTATVSVTVTNQGDVAETATVSLTGTAGTTSAAQTVNLTAAGAATLSFTWNTSGASAATHTLTARVNTIAGETDTADNTRSTTSQVTVATTKTLQVSVTTTNRWGGVRTSYRFGEYVYFTLKVTSSNVAVSGAAVRAEIRTPVGPTLTATGTTNTSGVARFYYYPSRTHGSGSYTMTATASKTGYTAGVGTTKYTVY